MTEYDAVVVGAGPNGLTAAAVLARAGRSVLVIEGAPTVGGGTRSAELTEPGFVHDVCSAIHPSGADSPAFRALDLAAHGLEFAYPEIDVAHPLDDGSAVALAGSVADSAAMLGADGARYARLMTPIEARWDDIADHIMGPVLRLPGNPLALARFGVPGLLPATIMGRLLGGPRIQALWAGLAAHSVQPLERLLTSSFAMMLAASGHRVGGWPVARGGSQSIADALAAVVIRNGGKIETGRWIHSVDELPSARVTLLDLTAHQVEQVAASRLPDRYRRRLRRFRFGPGTCKIDYALDGPVPWRAEEARRAGTVHLGGSMEEIAYAEEQVAKGNHPERPYVLVGQQSLADDSRAPAGKHTLWAYCHVPNGSDRDVSDLIENQIERFAPGFRDVVRARHVRTSTEYEAYNPSLTGGEIMGGMHNLTQILFRPVPAIVPYRTPAAGIYLCSASSPPGGGVHGMCGWNAAHAALGHELRT